MKNSFFNYSNELVNQEDIDPGIEEEDDEDGVEYDFEDLDERIIMCSKDEDNFMEEFKIWLQSVDGGFKPLRSASQHRNTVMSIVHYIDASNKNYEVLFSRPNLNSWVTYFENKKSSPGTVKTYLGSVKLFYKFVTITNPTYITVSPTLVGKMKEIVDQWCRNYTKKILIRKHRKQLELLATLPTPEDVRKLDASDYTNEVKSLFFSPSVINDDPSRKVFCKTRDYLISYLILDNASRSGAIANMTLEQYENATFQPFDGSSIISVIDHKTTATAGPAMLTVSATLMQYLTYFVEIIRNKVTDITCNKKDPVFTSWSGRKMAVSMISAQLSSFWKQAIGTDLKTRVTSNVIRKMATTAIHQNKPELKRDLANMMNHDIRTAEKDYFLQDKQIRVASTSVELKQVLRENFPQNSIAPERFQEIFYGESMNMDLVRRKMEEFPELNCLSEKQVYDMVGVLSNSVASFSHLYL